MIKKINCIYIFFALFFVTDVSAFAEDSRLTAPVLSNASTAAEQAILKRNQKREEMVQEYYKKGLGLANRGNLSEAREYFEKAIRIAEDPEMAGYIKESQPQARKQEIEVAYQKAIDLYNQKKYHPAQDAFEHVNKISFDYRGTSSYLKIIDQDIALANEALAKQKAEALDKQAAEIYGQAVELYKNKEFSDAKKKFEEVNWVVPNYKDTMSYMGRIDRDAKAEQEHLARQQQKTLQEQQARRQRELEAKELQHKNDVEEYARYLYRSAVDLFDQKDMIKALDKFNKIEAASPDYKSTRVYIARIEQWKTDHEKMAFEFQQETQEESLRQKELEKQRRQTQESKDKNDKAQKIYDQALNLYRDHQWEESENQFESVEQIIPDFKRTHRYLQKLEILIARNVNAKPKVVAALPAPADATATMLTPIKVAVTLEDQQKQAQDIAALAEKSAQLYRQIADIANDDSTVQAKKKMAQVDDMLSNLKEDKQRYLRQMRDEESRRLGEEAKARQEERMAEAERTYQDALGSIRLHNYSKAKIIFLELENIIPDYKATRHYLSHIDEDIKRENSEAVTNYEKMQAERLKQLQDKENADELRRAQEAQEKQHNKELQEQASLRELAQKASDINDDIILLSRQQDYEGMKAKFAELEVTITALTKLKSQIDKERDSQERNQQLAREAIQRHNELLRAQKEEDQQLHAYYHVQPLEKYRPALSTQPYDVDQYKRRDIMQEQNMLFSEGVDRYEHKKYSQAKLLFGELADQNDRRAEVWLKKVDRAITQELLRSQAGEERERTAFIADQVKAQRELLIIQERERQRQKRLNEELERQKRLYEDDRLLELRKEEVMKAQERERERQEEKRQQLEKANEKQQENLRFHKIEIVPKAQPVVAQSAVVPAPKPAPKAFVPSPIMLQVDARALARQKRIEERQARIQAEADARQKRLEEKKKEREHQEELRARREAERQARLKAEAEAKDIQAKAKAEKLAQEEKQREEALRQQTQEREERIKQEQMMREENQRRQELERQEQQRQAQLEAQREAVRKQLEDGVEAMYQEALSLYQQGEYTAAADKFKDVQDILPGYKRAGQYMDEARRKALSVNTQASVTTAPVVAPSSPSPVSRQENVSKALDLFDPNAK